MYFSIYVLMYLCMNVLTYIDIYILFNGICRVPHSPQSLLWTTGEKGGLWDFWEVRWL